MGEPVSPAPIEPMDVALVGCGHISAQYLDSLRRLPNLRLVSVTDPVAAAASRSPSSRTCRPVI